MDFDWTQKVTATKTTEALDIDQLDRSKYAKFLTEYLQSFTEQSYVMNLNAEWGAGKTYLLKRWHHTIKTDHPTVYIDAWKNDFSDDPLLTVISGILETLKRYPNVAATDYSKQVIKSGSRFLKQVAPALIKGLFRTYVGVDSDSFNLDDFDDFAEKAMEASLSDHNKKSEDLDEFKKTIGKWLNTSINSNGADEPKKPMFVFIDELDRCRPTYAIELLETVKHLFDIPGLVFVVATNTDQLQHSIKAVYGSEFDAQRYLFRFFNRSFTLKKPNIEQFITVQEVFIGTSGLGQTLLSTCDGNVTVTDAATVANNLAAIADFFEFDLRTTSQWLDQLKAIFPDSKSQSVHKYFWLASALISAIYLHKKNYYHSILQDKPSSSWGQRSDISEIKDEFSRRSESGKRLVKFSIKAEHLGNQEYDNRKSFNGYKNLSSTITVHSIFYNMVDFFSEPTISVNEMSMKSAGKFTGADVNAWKEIPFSVNLAMHYCASQKGATKDGYLDLTELASDLE
ncbi:MAG: P-loop NTPase fold protein [Saprospiraceae bacterium]|nr:P-loop NTPase fold protein [Saprospiraceae bacterium]